MLGAVRLAPARLGGPLAPRSAPCTLDAHSRMDPRPPRRSRQRRAPCTLQHRRVAAEEPRPAVVGVLVVDCSQTGKYLGHLFAVQLCPPVAHQLRRQR
eukprot:838526-Prymnesium_polylepis.1